MTRIFLMSFVLLLTACTRHITPINYPDMSLSSCKKTCQEQRLICGAKCKDSCLQCTRDAYHHAARNFSRYKHEQCVQGQFVMRELQSYADPLKCTKTTCECPDAYNVCIQACEGKIRKRLSVVRVCKGC